MTVARALRLMLYAVIGAGVYFIWLPDHSTHIGHMLGISRGTDLIIYIWILLNFSIILNPLPKIKRNPHLLTRLVQHPAVAGPFQAHPCGLSAEDKSPSATLETCASRQDSTGGGGA